MRFSEIFVETALFHRIALEFGRVPSQNTLKLTGRNFGTYINNHIKIIPRFYG